VTNIKALLDERWIKTADRLPDKDIPCWVSATKFQVVEICCFNTHHECWDDESADDFRYRTDQVTHWQPYIEPSRPKTA
jgi:hypothetical protein